MSYGHLYTDKKEIGTLRFGKGIVALSEMERCALGAKSFICNMIRFRSAMKPTFLYIFHYQKVDFIADLKRIIL